jgi:hypothetical protein
MIKKFVLNWAKRILTDYQKTEQTSKMTEAEKVRKEAIEKMRDIYGFVQFLHSKVFRNRRERKTFWRNVSEGQPVLEGTIQNIIDKYTESKGVKKPDVCGSDIKVDTKTCAPDCEGNCDTCANQPRPSDIKKEV